MVISTFVRITAPDPTRKAWGAGTTTLVVQKTPTVLVSQATALNARCIALLQVQTENGAMKVIVAADLAVVSPEFAPNRLLVRTTAANAFPAKTTSVTAEIHHCTQV